MVHDDSRLLTDTTLVDIALSEDNVHRKELTVEWPGMMISSLAKVVQVGMKSGSGMNKSILREQRLCQTSNLKPPSLVCPR